MSEKQLNHLPEEILLEVFRKMDFKTLMKSSLVCRKWNEMIEANSAIMKKVMLDVSFRKIIIPKPQDLTRKYQSIKMLGMDCDDVIGFINRDVPHLRHLELDLCGICPKITESLNKVLALLTKLETLIVRTMLSMNCSSEIIVDLSRMNNLKSLSLVFNFISISSFPATAQLKSLNLRFSPDYISIESLIDFLARQKSLENLLIDCGQAPLDNNINYEKLEAIQFPLKNLTFFNGCNLFGSEENLLVFMKKFVNTLEEVEIRCKFPASVYEMIFNDYHKLTKLKVHIDDAPEEDSFYSSLRPSLSVEKLIVYGHNPDLKSFNGFISKLPNLQTLILSYSNLSKEIMTIIANNLKMLEYLQVLNISTEAFDGINISSLKKIKILDFDRSEPKVLEETVRALPNIEEFEVDDFSSCEKIIDVEIVKIISEGWPKLKHLKLRFPFMASKEIFASFLSGCKNLKTIEINENVFRPDSEKEEIMREVKRDGFRFIINDYEEY